MVAIAPTALAGVIPSSSLRSRALGASRSRSLAGGGKSLFLAPNQHRGMNRRAGGATVAAWGSQKYVEHLIQPGDSLWKIAMDYNSTVDEIRAANGVKDKAGMIYEGKTLRVPVNTIQSNATPAADPVKTLVPPKKPRNLFAKEDPVFGPAPTAPPKKIERKAEEPKAKKAEPAPKETKKPTKNVGRARDDIPSRDAQKGQEAWRAPFRHMAKGKITPLTRTDVESLLPRKVFLGVSPTGDASAPRDADVLLLVEVPDSDACMAVYPTWKQLAERLARSAPNVRVCAFSAETDAAKQWAGRHLAATSHPTFVAMPSAGGVYKFGGETATFELLKKFADEAFKKQNRRNGKNELAKGNAPRVTRGHGGKTRHPMDKPHASSEYYRGIGTASGPIGAVVDASVQGAANVARMAAPLAIISLVVGFFMATALRILDLAFGESSAKVAGSTRGSAAAAAARLAADEFGEDVPGGDATTYPGDGPVDSRGRAIAPGAAARRSSVEAQTRLAREREAAREMRARAALSRDDAIPSGASAAKLVEWIVVVESEMRDLWRRFVFLFWAWIRLQRRLLLARFKPEGQDS